MLFKLYLQDTAVKMIFFGKYNVQLMTCYDYLCVVVIW